MHTFAQEHGLDQPETGLSRQKPNQKVLHLIFQKTHRQLHTAKAAVMASIKDESQKRL
jgi:hypothetical protein